MLSGSVSSFNMTTRHTRLYRDRMYPSGLRRRMSSTSKRVSSRWVVRNVRHCPEALLAYVRRPWDQVHRLSADDLEHVQLDDASITPCHRAAGGGRVVDWDVQQGCHNVSLVSQETPVSAAPPEGDKLTRGNKPCTAHQEYGCDCGDTQTKPWHMMTKKEWNAACIAACIAGRRTSVYPDNEERANGEANEVT